MSMVVAEFVGGLDDAALDDRLRRLEMERRRIVGEQAIAIAAAEHRQLHVVDGHHSMKSYLRATLNCSSTDATAWRKLARLVDTVPAAASALTRGRIGVAQAHELARVRANPRCGDRLVEVAPLLLEQAEQLEFDDFRTCVRRWELLADEDGADSERSRSVEARNASAIPFSGGIDLRATGGDALVAAEMIEILDAFTKAEFDADLSARLTEFGDDAAGQPLPRTGAQRRFDALAEIFRRAAHAPDGCGRRADITVSVVVDERTLAEHLSAHGLASASSLEEVVDPGPASRRCETTRGALVHPDDILAATVHGHVRRVVFDSAGVVIDLGRRRRLFTGAAREAAQLSARRCTRRGCTVPADLAEIDHLREHHEGGATDQSNAGPQCGAHNRGKHRGFRTVRDRRGNITHFRPDGSPMVAAGQSIPIADDPDLRCHWYSFEQLLPLDLDATPRLDERGPPDSHSDSS